MIGKKVLGSLLLLSLMMACQNVSPLLEDISPEPRDRYIELLVNSGFDEKDIFKREDGYLVEGDILYLTEQLDEFLASEGNIEERHREVFTCTPFADNLVDPILLRIDYATVPDYWRTALFAAMSNWNDLTGTKVRFLARGHVDFQTVPLADNHVLVQGENTDNCGGCNAYVTADFSSCNRLPSKLAIKTNIGSGSPTNRITILMHELAHVVGFHHTNTGEGTFISGTCVSDPESIMATTIWGDPPVFTTCDEDAIRLMYPE